MYWRCRVMLCTRQVILLRWPPPPPPNNKTCPWVSFNTTLSRWRHPAQPSFYFISHSIQYWNVELFARKKILILQFTLSGERFVFFISFYKINYLKRPQRNWIISREKRELFLIVLRTFICTAQHPHRTRSEIKHEDYKCLSNLCQKSPPLACDTTE